MTERDIDADELDREEQRARISKLQQEAAYIKAQRTLYPIVGASGVLAAFVAFVKLVF